MRMILVGAAGKMGNEVTAACKNTGDEIVAKVDTAPGYVENISDYCGKADVIIDFSSPTVAESVMNYAVKTKTPVVIATTGQDERQKRTIVKAAKTIPVFYSANLSLGIAVLVECVKNALKVFPQAQIEIEETHHAEKTDCPSGTALMIASKISEKKPVYARKGRREQGEIGITSLRYGKVFGIHKVILSCGEQTLTFIHEALSRAVFAEGALKAARFLLNQRSGVYDIFDLINET